MENHFGRIHNFVHSIVLGKHDLFAVHTFVLHMDWDET